MEYWRKLRGAMELYIGEKKKRERMGEGSFRSHITSFWTFTVCICSVLVHFPSSELYNNSMMRLYFLSFSLELRLEGSCSYFPAVHFPRRTPCYLVS